jgi:hypothetical protein
VTIPSSRRRDVGEMYPIREWLKVDCLTAVEPSKRSIVLRLAFRESVSVISGVITITIT